MKSTRSYLPSSQSMRYLVFLLVVLSLAFAGAWFYYDNKWGITAGFVSMMSLRISGGLAGALVVAVIILMLAIRSEEQLKQN